MRIWFNHDNLTNRQDLASKMHHVHRLRASTSTNSSSRSIQFFGEGRADHLPLALRIGALVILNKDK